MSEGAPEPTAAGTGAGGTGGQGAEPPEPSGAGAQPRSGRGKSGASGRGGKAGSGTQPAEGSTDDADAQSLLDQMSADSDDPEVLKQQAEHWKQMARKNESRARENSSAAKRLKEIEDADKSELQRANEAREAAESERDQARAQHNRVMAAASNDLPVELIDLLGSGTEDEINERAQTFATVIDARAQEIAEQMAANNGGGWQPGTGSARPVESMRPGSAPAQGGTPATADDWFRSLLGQRE